MDQPLQQFHVGRPEQWLEGLQEQDRHHPPLEYGPAPKEGDELDQVPTMEAGMFLL